MHETELTVNEIEIQAQALALSVYQTRPFFPRDHFEALNGLYGCEYTDQPLGDVVPLGNGSSLLLLSLSPSQGDIGATGSLGDCPAVLFDPLRLIGHKGFEILDEKATGGHESLHGIRPTDREIPLENKSVKTSYRSRDFSCMLLDKLPHGVPSLVAVWQLPL
jgi:hypothetical protein